MNIVNLILVISMYPFVFIMFFCLKNEGHNPKNGIYFGVSLNKEQAKEVNLQEITGEYDRQMRRYLWWMLLMPIPILFVPWFSIGLTYWCVWLIAGCVVFFIPFGIANSKLKELKCQKGWSALAGQPVYAELKEAGSIRKVKWYHFIVPVFISVSIPVWTLLCPTDGREVLLNILSFTFASMTFLFVAMAVWMDKQKTEIISTDSDINVNYARARKNMWKNFWVLCTWLNVICMLGMMMGVAYDTKLTLAFWLIMGLYILATVVLYVWLMRKNNALEKHYADKRDIKIQDDDAHWICGMFYYNAKDKHTMVNKRVGLGTTVNMATAVGKGTVLLVFVTLLSLPIVCIWCMVVEFTPIHLVVEENQLIARQVTEDYNIPLHSVKEVELLTNLPKMSRNHGTSLDHLSKGSYRIKEEGTYCKVFCNPQNNCFIRVETGLEIYIFSGYDDAETQAVYAAISDERCVGTE